MRDGFPLEDCGNDGSCSLQDLRTMRTISYFNVPTLLPVAIQARLLIAANSVMNGTRTRARCPFSTFNIRNR
jgi:hypothetical protein